MYLDFNGFFASCSQFAHPHLRGKPVGIVPHEGNGNTCIIACSAEAKKFGVQNVMPLPLVRRLCPEIILWPQEVDLYRRAHNYLMAEVESAIPIDAVKSIDELCSVISDDDRKDPTRLGREIKRRLLNEVGPWITCSIGFAPNRLLAKIACKDGGKDGLNVWQPEHVPAFLSHILLKDIPGIGPGTLKRLYQARIGTTDCLRNAAPKHLRQIWGNVAGERMSYAINGFDIKAQPTARSQYGHGRVLPPAFRSLEACRHVTRILAVKAARRMRRDHWSSSKLILGLSGYFGGHWSRGHHMAAVCDDMGVLEALERLWFQAMRELPPGIVILKADVSLDDLSLTAQRQLDFLADDEHVRRRQEAITEALDALNRRYGSTVVTVGPWSNPAADRLGAKISFTRIPRREDAW
ncbi:DinB/UmuC family translesion DNA polymerase [Asticcacaulis aquaticus]|uniref:Y-family DNA polymerase n=1 Tax=Asticcacaulis aquaticus TaxID=2984212 RepID=UPI0034A1AF17